MRNREKDTTERRARREVMGKRREYKDQGARRCEVRRRECERREHDAHAEGETHDGRRSVALCVRTHSASGAARRRLLMGPRCPQVAPPPSSCRAPPGQHPGTFRRWDVGPLGRRRAAGPLGRWDDAGPPGRWHGVLSADGKHAALAVRAGAAHGLCGAVAGELPAGRLLARRQCDAERTAARSPDPRPLNVLGVADCGRLIFTFSTAPPPCASEPHPSQPLVRDRRGERISPPSQGK